MSGWTQERHEALKREAKDLSNGCLWGAREQGRATVILDTNIPCALAEIERLRELLKDAQDSLDVEGILEEGERDIWR